MLNAETIVAQATAPGRGGVAIVRISGPKAQEIGKVLCLLQPSDPNTELPAFKPRYALFKSFYDSYGQCIDQGILIFFPGPNSFTGEDVVEIQGHGGPYVVQRIIKRCCELGARRANPGEFSLRAFLNDKIDLAQAEAIADLIDAQSEQAAHCAMASLQGEFSKRVQALAESLLHIRIYVEAAMDFPEEEIDFLQDIALRQKIEAYLTQMNQMLAASRQGVALRDGLSVAILGAPNAGKSSLLNLLSGEETAIVTDIAGTTRDVLRCDITLAGYPLNIADTAGLRETDNPVEQEGIRRANITAQQSQHIFFLIDALDLLPDLHIKSALLDQLQISYDRLTIIVNKIDILNPEQISKLQGDLKAHQILMSARTGQGLKALENIVIEQLGGRADESQFTARQRHIAALEAAYTYCEQGYQQLLVTGSGELFAEDLKLAHRSLGEITGAVSSDDLLGHIFSSFCIGK